MRCLSQICKTTSLQTRTTSKQNSQSPPSHVCKMEEFADWQVKMISLQTRSLNVIQFADWHVARRHPCRRVHIAPGIGMASVSNIYVTSISKQRPVDRY